MEWYAPERDYRSSTNSIVEAKVIMLQIQSIPR